MVSSYNIGEIIIRGWDWARGLYPSCAHPQVPSLGLLQLQEGWQHVQCAAGVPTHSTGCGWTQGVWCFLHPQGQAPCIKHCHRAAPTHKRRWWHFQSRTNPQCHNACEKEDLLCGCTFSVSQSEVVFAEGEWVHVPHRAEVDALEAQAMSRQVLFSLGVLQSWLICCPCSSPPAFLSLPKAWADSRGVNSRAPEAGQSQQLQMLHLVHSSSPAWHLKWGSALVMNGRTVSPKQHWPP